MIDTLAVSGMMNVFIIIVMMMLGVGTSAIFRSRTGVVLSIAIGGALLF